VDIVGEVVESEPPRRLALTWAAPKNEGNPEKTSRVTFALQRQVGWPGGPWVQLRIEHADLDSDPEMLESITWGWPAVSSGLKTVLECGGLEPSPGS
jgi:uncharacterized protein YndB with AHSA1/START domain